MLDNNILKLRLRDLKKDLSYYEMVRDEYGSKSRDFDFYKDKAKGLVKAIDKINKILKEEGE